MKTKKNILFGIDGSDFAMQALVAVGELLQTSQNLKMSVFHGASDPNFALLTKLFGEDAEAAEKHKERWISNAQQVLESAAAAARGCGLAPERLSTLFEERCNDPAGAILSRADAQDIETIAVARWGKATVSRQVIGSVTYRLAHLSNQHTLWVIDPRIGSRDVLVGLVGAPISRRVLDYTVRYFGHLGQSRFTFFHVVPPVPPQFWGAEGMGASEETDMRQKVAAWLQEYTEKVKAIAKDAKQALIAAGIPEQNIAFKFQPQKRGIARDILMEMEEGNHGILVIGRKGFKDIQEFGLGSKASKVLIAGRAFILCLVH